MVGGWVGCVHIGKLNDMGVPEGYQLTSLSNSYEIYYFLYILLYIVCIENPPIDGW